MTTHYSAAGGTEHSVAGGAERFVTQDADCSVAGGTEGSVAGGLSILGVHFWLVLHIDIPVLFMFFLILVNGAVQYP